MVNFSLWYKVDFGTCRTIPLFSCLGRKRNLKWPPPTTPSLHLCKGKGPIWFRVFFEDQSALETSFT